MSSLIDSLSVPNGWALTTLGNVLLAVVGGGTPSRKVPAYFDGSIPWFTVKDMKALKPGDAEEHISDAAIIDSATNLIPENTLIVATRIALGRAIRPTIACAINQDLKALIVGTGIDADFLLYWIGANERVIQDLGSGTTVSGIRLETLHALKLLLPPSAEQTRIVQKLEELLSDLDAGIAELKAAQKKLAQYRQSLLKAAVEGALTAEWRASRDSVRPEPVEGRFSVSPQTEGGESSPVRSKSVHASTSSGRTDLLADAREYPSNPVRPEPVEGRFSVSLQAEGGESSPVRSKSVHALRQGSGQASTGSARTDLLADAREYPSNPVRPEPVEGRFSVSLQAEGIESSPVRSKSVHASTGSARTDLLVDAQEYSANPVRPEPFGLAQDRPFGLAQDRLVEGRTAGAETGPQLLERILRRFP